MSSFNDFDLDIVKIAKSEVITPQACDGWEAGSTGSSQISPITQSVSCFTLASCYQTIGDCTSTGPSQYDTCMTNVSRCE